MITIFIVKISKLVSDKKATNNELCHYIKGGWCVVLVQWKHPYGQEFSSLSFSAAGDPRSIRGDGTFSTTLRLAYKCFEFTSFISHLLDFLLNKNNITHVLSTIKTHKVSFEIFCYLLIEENSIFSSSILDELDL